MTPADTLSPRRAACARLTRGGWITTPIAVVLTALLGGACDSASALASDVRNRTVPDGDPRPSLSSAVRSEASLRYEWDVETRMSTDAYARWVVISLRRHMDALATEPPELIFARYTSGDRLRLHLLLEATPGGAHVHAVLTATPD